VGTATEQRACGVVTVTVALVGCVRWCAVPRGMYRIDPGRSPIGGLVGPTVVYAPLAAADWARPVRPDLGVGVGRRRGAGSPGLCSATETAH
jgi:hypothetical protein